MEEEKELLCEIITELIAIKKLLAVQLLRNGATQAEVSLALGVHQTTVGRMFPRNVINPTEN